MTSHFHRLMYGLIGIAILLSLSTLLIYPLPTCDETSYASAALSITVPDAHAPLSYGQGIPGQDGLGVILSFGRKISTYNLVLAGLMRTFSASLLVARFFAWCGWITAAALTFMLGRKVHSQTIGLISALLFMTSTKAYLTGHTARPEIWVTAVMLAALICAYQIIAATKPQAWWMVVGAGAMSVWAGEIHMQGMLFTAGIGIVVFIEVGMRQRRWREFALFALGVTLGMGLWLAMLAASGIGFDQILRLGRFASPISTQPPSGTTSGSPIKWVRNLITLPDWLRLIFWISGKPIAAIEALFALIGISAAIWKRDRAGLYLVGVALIAMLLFGIAHRNRWVQYGVVWSPIWYLTGTIAITRIKRHEWGIIGLATAHIAGMAWLGWQYRDGFKAYDATGTALREAIPVDVSVAADPIWWWYLNDREFLADEYFTYSAVANQRDIQAYLDIDEEVELQEATTLIFERIAPEYFVVDSAMACNTLPNERYAAMRSLVEDRCEAVVEVGKVANQPLGTSSLGQVNEIYRCGN